MKGTVLIAGFATRHVVQSAWRAGYEVCAIDHFCDQDLTWYAKEWSIFEELDQIPSLIEDYINRYPIDAIITTSGAETIAGDPRFCGTPPDIAGRFLDKSRIQEFFLETGIPAPAVLPEGVYPAFIKPLNGAGGWRNSLVRTEAEEEAWRELWPDDPYIRQTPISGTPCSVSCIANGTEARAIAVNEQFMRGGDGERAFGFAGACTPFATEETEALADIAERIVTASGCVGSVGVDFIVSEDGIYAIEINPRFQATLDIVEESLARSVFDLHLDACRGRIPPVRPLPAGYVARTILFADHDLRVGDDLKHLAPAVADIPWKGTEIEEGSAVISVYGRGSSRDEALSLLDKTITQVREYMSRW
ncbi:ATP-dependent carboligase [Methanomicrobiaceae archaeon CYW5]|uniref:ATP-grasp domain-containing protein n=1 Tax=Methanovulcanius yangii TaxID=1789227 RepID=UPI0029CA631C|nr:ATP-grasp domain-containing protein [Methanovulcanius yangii]MBT8507768.1 ATP-dependent carboligase [Methanovulcanius yangii]